MASVQMSKLELKSVKPVFLQTSLLNSGKWQEDKRGLRDTIVSLWLFRDVSKFAMHFIVEEIDADTSMEELQKMMLVALVYRILVCFYEVSPR